MAASSLIITLKVDEIDEETRLVHYFIGKKRKWHSSELKRIERKEGH